jgi:LAO/AO transport system ATPase
MLEALLQRFRQTDRRALSRLLTLAARGEQVSEILAGLGTPRTTCRVVAITGSGGVGKSSLIGRLIEFLRGRGETVAVLACDPQSPLSGGALLGDRFRMPSRPDDDGVFIRSLAAVSGRGAIAEHLPVLVRLLEVFGFAVVLIETVGAGQGDTAVRETADVVVLLLQPESGDDLQWEKAGVLEVADVVAVHKADLPGAEQTAAQIRSTLDLSGSKTIPVVLVSAKTGQGIEELWRAVASCPLHRASQGPNQRELLRRAQELLAARFHQAEAEGNPRLLRLLQQWQQGQSSPDEAGAALIHLLGEEK